MKVNAITLRAGHVLDYNGKLWVVLKHEIMQPGKGASVIQIDMRDVRGGNKDSVRFRTQEVLERVRLDQAECQYLYTDDTGAIFMDNENFEQMSVPLEIMGDRADFLSEGMVCTVESYEGSPLGVELPDTVVVTIETCEPAIKGQTATTSYKPGELANGRRIMIPPHIDAGTRVVVKTEDGSYVEKAKG